MVQTSASPLLSKAETPTITSLLQGMRLELVQEILPKYLPHQRWFGGKSKVILSARISSSVTLAGGEYAVACVEVIYADQAVESYQLPLAIACGEVAEELQRAAPKAILANLGITPDDASTGYVLFDATASEGFRQSLLDLFNKPGNAGAEITASRSLAFLPQTLSGMRSRVGSTEQSNTSILFGEQAILKLFRRVQPGENPDVEMTRFLTDVTHFKNIPAYLGELHRSSDQTTLAFLQAFAPNQGDGWSWFAEELARFYESVEDCTSPASRGKPASFLNCAEIPTKVQEHAGLALNAATLLGTRTAEMHLALATPTDDSAFTAQAATREDLAHDAARVRDQAERAMAALQRSVASVPNDLADRAALLLSRRDDLLYRAQALAVGSPEDFGQRLRIHGDYHLGQLLRVESDFFIVDFEGEPARPLAERREKQSPLKDVAGMLRSFSYASQSALDHYVQRRPEKADSLSAWASLWENAVSTSFLEAYSEAMQQRSDLIPQPPQAEVMLLAFLLEKSLYELLYELNNRPTWLHIPLNALLVLASNTA